MPNIISSPNPKKMIAIIDYKSGNIRSLENAIKKLGYQYQVTSNPGEIQKSTHIIFPGQSRAGSAMRNLKELDLVTIIQDLKKPFLGICLGMQLLLESTEEDNTPCLNVIPGKCQALPESTTIKVPQIGWNSIQIKNNNPEIANSLLKNIPNNSYFYFANSYIVPATNKCSQATTQHGVTFSSIIQKENFYGVQFHPERSGEKGMGVLKNFCEM